MQQRLFLPRYGFQQVAGHAEVWRHVVGPHGLMFKPEDMRGVIARGLRDLPPDRVPVISSEILSGHPFFGGIGSDVYAHRLHEIVPAARILVTVRSQLPILRSVYMQYLLRGGTMSAKAFFAGDRELGFHGFRAEHFEYHRLVALYRHLFGAENVLVLSQEGLKADLDGAARRIACFAGNATFDRLSAADGAAYSPSYPEYAAPILRQINKFQQSVLNPAPVLGIGRTPKGFYRLVGGIMRRPPFSWLLRRYRPISRHVEKTFTGRYEESNRALYEMLDGDVALPLGGANPEVAAGSRTA